MARVETVVPSETAQTAQTAQSYEPPVLYELVQLRPGQIETDRFLNARPGPEPPDKKQQIEALARNMRELGQIVPVVVQRFQDRYRLLDGRSRHEAAQLLDTDEEPFRLTCVVRSIGTDSLRAAIQANLRRRGYGHLQFAYLCRAVREQHGWTGTAEVAKYLGVSRAQVSQHDRLLNKPAGMPEYAFQEILDKVSTGGMSGEAAFYALQHVEPQVADVVMRHAEDLAKAEAQAAGPELPEQLVSGTKPELEAEKPQGRAAAPVPPPTTTRTAPARPSASKRETGPPKKAKVERKHIQQAAKELDAQRTVKTATGKDAPPLQRTLADLRAIAEQLRGASYPDCMRNFISMLFGVWFRGDAADSAVLTAWTQIAALVEESLERHKSQHGVPHNPHNPHNHAPHTPHKPKSDRHAV